MKPNVFNNVINMMYSDDYSIRKYVVDNLKIYACELDLDDLELIKNIEINGGIYILVDTENESIYIGKSANIYDRINQHVLKHVRNLIRYCCLVQQMVLIKL